VERHAVGEEARREVYRDSLSGIGKRCSLIFQKGDNMHPKVLATVGAALALVGAAEAGGHGGVRGGIMGGRADRVGRFVDEDAYWKAVGDHGDRIPDWIRYARYHISSAEALPTVYAAEAEGFSEGRGDQLGIRDGRAVLFVDEDAYWRRWRRPKGDCGDPIPGGGGHSYHSIGGE
jgi:hypothetical protein